MTGKYLCIAIAEDGVNFTAPENNDQYVELKKGGKGEIYTDLAFELTWKLDGETFSGSYQIFGIDAPVTGTLKDGVLEIHDDDMVMRYLKEGAEAPDWAKDVAAAAAEPAETDDPLLAFWNGDWYGWWFMYGCKGSYEEFEGAYWDCEAHIEIDPDTYTGTMEMWDDEQYQNMGGIGMVDVSLSESGTGAHGTLMSEGGWFEEMTLSHADWIIDPGLDESDNFLIITGSYDDDTGNVYYYKMMMRKWGELWEDIDESNRPWSYTGFPLRLGLREDGLIYALAFWDEAGGETLSICALLPGNGMLVLTQLAGGSPFGLAPGRNAVSGRNLWIRRNCDASNDPEHPRKSCGV